VSGPTFEVFTLFPDAIAGFLRGGLIGKAASRASSPSTAPTTATSPTTVTAPSTTPPTAAAPAWS
jgi:hypothetical protein